MKSRRRGNGEGSIYQRKDGQWCGSISLGKSADGRRNRKIVYGRSREEVRDKLLMLQVAQQSGRTIRGREVGLDMYLRGWLDQTARVSVRKSTLLRYAGLVENHIIPAIGGLPLGRLGPGEVRRMMATLEGAGMSPRSRQLVLGVLSCALKHAVYGGLIDQNPCRSVRKPRVERKDIRYLSEQETRRLLDAASGDPYEALYCLAVTTGLRLGELLGLQWSDVDLRGRRLSVRRTLQDINGTLEVSEPKTRAGRRNVDLGADVAARLSRYRKNLGIIPRWVFFDSNRGPLRPSNFVRRRFKPLLKAAGLPDIRFHDLRHTAATLMLLRGVHPKVVQERLGHATISITLDTYSHVSPTMQRDVADSMDALLRPA